MSPSVVCEQIDGRLGRGTARRVGDVHGMQAAGDIDHRATAEKPRDGVRVDRRRHDHDAQVGARAPCLLGEGDRHVGVDAALVKLVDDDRPEIREQRILLKARRENAFRCGEQARFRSEPPLKPDVPADLASNRPAALLGNAPDDGAGGYASRLKQDDRAVADERGRHARRLSRARLRHHNHRTRSLERSGDFRKIRIDRKFDHLTRGQADRTAHARAAEAAVAVRVLREVLLVVVLGVEELWRRKNFSRDRPVACARQFFLEGIARGVRGFLLRRIESVDAGAILRAGVVALPHALRGIVVFPKRLEEILVADGLRIEHDEDRLVVPGHPAAHFAVGRVRRPPGGVANGGRVDARELPEFLLRAPEAAHAEHRLLEAVRKRRCEPMTVHEMRRGFSEHVSIVRKRNRGREDFTKNVKSSRPLFYRTYISSRGKAKRPETSSMMFTWQV